MKKILLVVVLLSNFFWLNETNAQTVRNIVFPVIGNPSYWDDFGAPRGSNGERAHAGNDLFARKMTPMVSPVDGTVRSVTFPEATWGYSVTIEDDEGYTYHYLHMNNDTPGTDNGNGGPLNAYAVDMMRGNRVVAGQLIGYMGDSGNAETTPSHLHFEIRRNGEAFSPFESLRAARRVSAPADYPALPNEILPYGLFRGGASVAAGNLDSDAEPEIVTGAGVGGGPHVQIFDKGSQTPKAGFFAYALGFTGGIDVATGDIDGDGIDEIITAPDKGGGPHIRVFKPDGTEVLNFLAYDERFRGGVRVAAADVNNDGKVEIITAPASGGGPHVKIFNSDGSVFWEFFAYDPKYNMGIDIAATGNKIITVPNTGGGPHVKVFDMGGALQSEFMAYDEGHRGGVRLSAANNQIFTAPLLGGPDFRKFDLNGNKLDNGSSFEVWWPGSWDVAAFGTDVFTSTGPNANRRTSVRELDFQSRNINFQDF